MGKVKLFTVVFAREKKVYYPGEVLNGAVMVKLNKDLKLRGIRVEFRGESRVRWSESKSSSSGRSSRTFHNKEVYINTSATLFGKTPGQKADNPVLATGDYSYPFSFPIPQQNLPSSYENRYGHIRYWLKAIIDRPWRFDVTTKEAFSIIEYVDINVYSLLNPMQKEINRSIGIMCCISGPLTVVARTDRGGYCPGESIAMSLYINNKTNQTLPNIEIRLVQHTTFTASTGRQKNQKQCVQNVPYEGVPRGDDRHYPSIHLPVPSVPPTMSSCKCIKISYEIKVIVRVSGFHNSSKLIFPVVVGSVPYRPPLPSTPYHQPTVEPSAPPMLDVSAVVLPQYSPSAPNPRDQPPSYAQCVYGGGSIRDEDDGGEGAMGEMNFIPVYPFVNNYQPPTPSAPAF